MLGSSTYIYFKYFFYLIVLVITFERRNEKEKFRSGFEVIKILQNPKTVINIEL